MGPLRRPKPYFHRDALQAAAKRPAVAIARGNDTAPDRGAPNHAVVERVNVQSDAGIENTSGMLN